jgi:hypothetical protein
MEPADTMIPERPPAPIPGKAKPRLPWILLALSVPLFAWCLWRVHIAMHPVDPMEGFTGYGPGHCFPEAVEQILDDPDRFVLYALDPHQERDNSGKVIPTGDAFHSYPVLGKTEVQDKAEQSRLWGALRQAAADNHGMAANCFIPHHGLHVESNGRSVEMVICFHCLQVYVYLEGETKTVYIMNTPLSAFDAVLREAGIATEK